jgi:hypothetical protein
MSLMPLVTQNIPRIFWSCSRSTVRRARSHWWQRAAVSVVATFLAGLYAAGATAVYAAATLVASNRRLPAGGPPRPGLRYHMD